MTFLSLVLSLAALVSAAAAILADYKENRSLVYVLRPLTMVLIILIALQAARSALPSTKYLILAGLCACLAGDVFMILRSKKVMAGMASFFIALLLYIGAFSTGLRFSFAFWPFLVLVTYGVFFTKGLLPHLGRKKIPVIFYVAAMTIMAWLSAERYIQMKESHALSAYVGAVLFLISDSAWAVNNFVRKRRFTQVLILSSYFAAQWLIAVSIH
ncbi:MAG: lysoplasmalogenase [Candidatus Aminicenantes bacterium]|nr:lysoplasmalogenase [Candidatus Aminicenantes bacterium]